MLTWWGNETLLMPIVNRTSVAPQNAEEGLQAIPVHSWLLHGVIWLRKRPLLPDDVVLKTYSFI